MKPTSKYPFLPLLIISFGVLLAASTCAPKPAPELTVSAAANLIPAFEEIGRRFEAQTGIKVVYNFSSSGKLTQQIEQGAPVDVFASANEAYVTRLVEGGFINEKSKRIYAQGRLVIWSRQAGLLPSEITDLTSDTVESVAMANPQHAPYGVVARNVLQHNQLWQALQPRLVLGNDVRQTLTYAQTGDVAVALVPLSLVINLDAGAYSLIPTDNHPPISQALGIVSESPRQREAQLFVDFVLSREGQAILKKYGYEPVR